MSDRTREKLIKAVLYILMMAIIVLAVVLLVKSVLPGLFSENGKGNWTYKALPGGYEICRTDPEDIHLAMTEEDGKGSPHEAVGPYISAFWHDDRYIVIKQYPGKKDGNYDRFYYFIDTETDEIFGPLDNMEYSSLCREKGIQIEKWILTVPKPDGAE